MSGVFENVTVKFTDTETGSIEMTVWLHLTNHARCQEPVR
jgi:hypothetical protein